MTKGSDRPRAQLPERLTPRAPIVAARHGDKTVLLDVSSGKYYSLNRTGAQVWQCLCEHMSPVEIIDRLQREWQLPADIVERDVITLLGDCAAASLFAEKWKC
jgi:hypothetical protein